MCTFSIPLAVVPVRGSVHRAATQHLMVVVMRRVPEVHRRGRRRKGVSAREEVRARSGRRERVAAIQTTATAGRKVAVLMVRIATSSVVGDETLTPVVGR